MNTGSGIWNILQTQIVTLCYNASSDVAGKKSKKRNMAKQRNIMAKGAFFFFLKRQSEGGNRRGRHVVQKSVKNGYFPRCLLHVGT